MFRYLTLLTVCSLVSKFSAQQIDLNICPNGLTTSPSDPQWPTVLPNRFEIVTELTTDVETIEITQLFIGSQRDAIYFHNYERNFTTLYDFTTNEMLTFNDELNCDRLEIGSQEQLSYVTSQIAKPSVLLGFDGRNNANTAFYTRYLGIETIRDGIRARKFQSCFYLTEENLTVNATYYISDPPPNQAMLGMKPDFLQIDVRSNNYPYTYNIIRYVPNPSLTITTSAGIFCPNRVNTKDFPRNLPPSLSVYAEAYTPKDDGRRSRIESYNRLMDESLQIERVAYTMNKVSALPPPSALLVDYSSNINYLYTHETQQCMAMNVTAHSMGTTNEILFQFGDNNNATRFQYTGLASCGREHVQCHRWIGRRDFGLYVTQYEWYWSAKYNDIDLPDLIPIKVNVISTSEQAPSKRTNQEIIMFNYNPHPNSMQVVDSTLGECFRALGPSHSFNYAVLRLTLNNDAKHPVHQHLLSLENQLHMTLASELRIRHIRLSSFVIDISRDTTEQQDKDVDVTFTLLDNPPQPAETVKEPSSLQLIRHLARQINDGKLLVRDNDGGYELQARPNSLRTLVLYLLPSENHTDYFNQTVFVYHNITQPIYRQRQKIVQRHTGPLIAAFWMGFALLGMVVTLAISSFVAIRKWTPKP